MTLLDEYKRTKKELEALKEKNAQYRGRIESYKDSLKNKGFPTIDKAIEYVRKAEKELIQKEKQIQKNLEIMNERILEYEKRFNGDKNVD